MDFYASRTPHLYVFYVLCVTNLLAIVLLLLWHQGVWHGPISLKSILLLQQHFYSQMCCFVCCMYCQNINGEDISTVQLDHLRAQFGIVSQEPVLFDRTIAENIAYGDNSRKVPMEEIIDAAKKSNIHNFILSLPLVSHIPFWVWYLHNICQEILWKCTVRIAGSSWELNLVPSR